MKRNKKRKLFTTTMGGRAIKIPKYDGGPVAGGRVGGDFVQTFNKYKDMIDAVSQGADSAHRLYKDIQGEIDGRLKSNVTSGFTVTYQPSDATSGDTPIAPASVTNSQSKVSLANVSDDRCIHKTVYETGVRSTSAVLTAKKVGGSAYRVLVDSKIDVSSLIDRNILTQGSGFNQKQYHVPPIKAQVATKYIKDLVNLDATLLSERFAAGTVYSNVMSIKQQFMIKNNSFSMPMDFTIHLVKIKNNAYSPISLNSMFARAFYDADDFSGGNEIDFTTAKRGFVPKYLQHTGLDQAGDGDMQSSSVQVSNKMTSLKSSSSMRAGLDFVESFKKTIAPGDYWNFSHIHNCGAGIDLRMVYRSANVINEASQTAFGLRDAQDQQPFTFGVIFETKGKMSEAFSIPAENSINTYLGTSPTYYMYEFKVSAYFSPDASVQEAKVPSTRIYETDSTLSLGGFRNETREYFVTPDNISPNILDASLAGSVGRTFIPMATSTVASAQQYEGIRDPG